MDTISTSTGSAVAVQKNAKVWARADDEWYVEPQRVTEQLLEVERFIGPIWDPCCGGGNVVKACIQAGYVAFGSDIVRRVGEEPWFIGEGRFEDYERGSVANIISNPPYKSTPPLKRGNGTEAFIRHAIAAARGKVAVFCALSFLAGEKRARGFYAEHVPHRVWVLTPRPSCPPGYVLQQGGKASGGTEDWCWLVFDNAAPPVSGPTIGWLKRPKTERKFHGRAKATRASTRKRKEGGGAAS